MWWFALAHAEMPLPDYEDVLVQRRWHEVDRLIEAACHGGPAVGCSEEPLQEAIAKATAFQDQVTPDARLEYLIGLAHLSGGDDLAGERHLTRALDLDPDRSDAWHDLGEVYLQQGRFDQAASAFAAVSRLVPTGSKAWLGPWREAEVAAHRSDADAFERHMKEALRRGFSFRTIRGLPNWKLFLADPEVGPVVRKLVTVYGSAEILQSLEAE